MTSKEVLERLKKCFTNYRFPGGYQELALTNEKELNSLVIDLLRDVRREKTEKRLIRLAMNSTYGLDAKCPACHRSCLEMTNEQIEELKDVNKKLSNEIEELVHKYDTINRDIQDKLDIAREANKTIKENAAKLIKEKEELIKVLNIYQAITDIDYDIMTNTGMVRLNGADGAGRAFIHDGDAARALYSSYVKYYDNSFKYKPGEKPDYKMTKKEQDEWDNRDIIDSACYAMESLAKSARDLSTHLEKRRIYLTNPKTLKVPVEFMLEDARYNFPFLREKRVWALDTCRTNVIRIEVMYGKPYYYDFNRQSLTAIDVLMED